MPALTKASVGSMNEAALRSDICVPLLKLLGYEGVFEWHGRAGELGKDVVGWKRRAQESTREGIAIVAKAKVPKSNPDLSDIAGQVAQALNEPF